MFLVTTADESTWADREDICFLGEWCRRYSRKAFWEKFNACVIPYHWDDRAKYNRDYYYLDHAYEDCLKQLSGELNRINNVSNDIDYWRIVIGPWLRFFIDALFDRFEIIRNAAEFGAISDTWLARYSLADWVADGFADFYRLLTDDKWNHVIFAECIREIGLPHSEVPNGIIFEPLPRLSNLPMLKVKLMRNILEVYQKCIPSRLNRHVLISPYISRFHTAHFQWKLGQLPYLISPSWEMNDVKIDSYLRESISIELKDTRFESLLKKLIPIFLPKVYLENYHYFYEKSLARYPKKPATIFTANAYQGDDGFKFWAADMRKNGTPLIIGQHGGNMGIAHHNQTEDHQIKIADSFCTWGWTHNSIESIYPLPSLQLSQREKLNYKSNGEILLVFASIPRYFYCHFSMPIAGQVQKYINDQILLVSSLKAEARSLIRLRLNGDEFGWDIAQRLKDAGMDAQIDRSDEKFRPALSKYRLCIVSYNATVILETMSANFPTIAYWDPEYFDVRADAIPILNKLKEVGILHDTVESATQLINHFHDDVQNWWQRPALQEVRREFCNKYAYTSERWINDWKSHFKSIKVKITI